MTPDESASILVRLDHQDEAIGEIKTTVHEVLKQAKATNGRVTRLETANAVEAALKEQLASTLAKRTARVSWLTPVVAACGSTFGAVVLAHFIG